MLRNCCVTVYVPDYVTVICVLGSGTNEGSIPRSGRGRPPSLFPTVTVLGYAFGITWDLLIAKYLDLKKVSNWEILMKMCLS